MAVLLLLLIWENGHPSYWNYTSGFGLNYWSSRILAFCFDASNLKFLSQTVPVIWRGTKISEVGQVTPSRPIWPFCISFVSTAGDESACKIWLLPFAIYGGVRKCRQ